MATHILDLSKAEIPEIYQGLLPLEIPLLKLGTEYLVAEDEIDTLTLTKLRAVRSLANGREFSQTELIIVSRTKLLPGAKIRRKKL